MESTSNWKRTMQIKTFTEIAVSKYAREQWKADERGKL